MRRERWHRLSAVLFPVILFALPGTVTGSEPAAVSDIAHAALPPEAQQTLQLIKRGGPYPYQRDGVAFGNYERLLPLHDRGYYREYAVPAPRVKNRGIRRIVSGKKGEYYYTDDHYRSFRRIRE